MRLPGRYHRRLTRKSPTEAAQMARIRAGLHLITDEELREIRDDAGTEVAREIADQELQRRAGLSAHERLAERAAQAHPLYPHVRSWRDEMGTCWWGLGDRQVVWSKQLRWREDALRYFLAEMTAHETVAMIRRLGEC